MEAIASTIQNRYNLNRESLGGQDLKRILEIGYEGMKGSAPVFKNEKEAQELKYAEMISDQLIHDTHVDTVKGATHFDKSKTAEKYQDQSKYEYVMQVGGLHFFREK